MELAVREHVGFISGLDSSMDATDDFDYWALEHLRMSALYWAITSLMLIKGEAWEESSPMGREEVLDFVRECQNEDGGFGGNRLMDSHVLFTLSAVQVALLLDSVASIDTDGIVRYIRGLQNADGSFRGDGYGEVDTRFTFCAVTALSLLDRLDAIDAHAAVEHLGRCGNFDGGYGAVPGAESHAGQSTQQHAHD